MSDDAPPAKKKRYVTRGPRSRHVPVDRNVKHFAISEHELTTIGICNAQVAIWSSVASVAVTFIAACIWDMVTSNEINVTAAATCVVFAGLVAGAAGILAYKHHQAKENEIRAILDETEDDESDVEE